MRCTQIFLLVLFLTVITNVNGQYRKCNCIDDKGIIIGYNNTSYQISMPSDDAGQYNNSGFMVGFFADIELSERFHVQPEFLYTMSFSDGIGFNTIAIPLITKFFITEKISLQAGPMFDVILDRAFMGNSGINFMIGAGVNITEGIAATVRYSHSLTSRGYTYKNEPINYDFNYFQVGLAFRLWKKPSF
ncbi:Outer membrane protein beta-barrel domain-containing protein [Tenacibaculum sp. MAR_2009_124]|uniref:outer membrane beta-barrel protein n=1 Tax=Tenacibaculum sp. MAR_2009_124 TaxID=1250059 RepID=UPI0008951278|nr:outer membrane beta-barrel protein [Tenacibaculum sp. MAR_2009_124]SEC39312.1 Outer membrane protein beta-barrel domain-containing protein [Tenacibaculum sp. MAR_2009_124]